MKPVKNSPELLSLANLLETYNEILISHAQAKVVSLPERRKILSERRFILEKYKSLSKVALSS